MTQTSSSNDELLNFACSCVHGAYQEVNIPKVGMYIDILVGSQDFVGGNEPKIGNKFIKTIAIEGFPMESYPAMLDGLSHIPIEYRWNSRFIYLDKEEAESLIDKQRRKWKQKVRGFKDQLMNSATGAINFDAQNMAEDAEMAMSESSSGVVRFGYYNSVIILMHQSKKLLDEAVELTVKSINNLGFVPRVETINAIESYLGSLPGHGYHNVRRSIINTLNLSDLLPTTAIWLGLKYNICPFYPKNSAPLFYAATTGYSPFRVSLHVGDVGHTLIVGPTGSGKSTLVSFIMAQHFRYDTAQVFCFDKGYSSFILSQACGGDHYDIGNSHFAFCPLANVDQPNEKIWAENWLETLLELQGVKVTPNHRQKIHNAIELLANSSSRTLTDFVSTLQDLELREALVPYTLAGAMGKLFDAKSDNLNLSCNNTFQVFEMEHLMALGERNIVPVLDYLFHKIEANLDGSPSLIVLDEAWLFVSHPTFKNKIKEWLKVLRKKNTAVIFATQSIADISNSPIREVIYESCPTKILLPNPEAGHEICIEEYRRMGLNNQQIDIIKTAIPKRHYYYVSPLGKRLFELGLGPVAKAFVSVSDQENIKLAKSYMGQYEQSWPSQWLKAKVSEEWEQAWLSVY
jgi:type IV secretion system protein VirB4